MHGVYQDFAVEESKRKIEFLVCFDTPTQLPLHCFGMNLVRYELGRECR